jgi:two-component system, LytTR family, response regulator
VILQTVIVDDEKLARRGVRALLERAGDVSIVQECADGAAAIQAIRETSPDLVYLDVEMPGMSGFDVIREIGSNLMPHVIFVTAFDQYAIRAFDACALDYLLKPLNEERFAVALERARIAVSQRRNHDVGERLADLLKGLHSPVTEPREPVRPGFYPVRSGERIVLLRIEDISVVVAAGNYVSLHAKGKAWLARATMSEIESEFAMLGFVRIHRSTVINVDRVQELLPLENGEFEILLQDGQRYRLSRSYRAAVKKIVGHDL